MDFLFFFPFHFYLGRFHYAIQCKIETQVLLADFTEQFRRYIWNNHFTDKLYKTITRAWHLNTLTPGLYNILSTVSFFFFFVLIMGSVAIQQIQAVMTIVIASESQGRRSVIQVGEMNRIWTSSHTTCYLIHFGLFIHTPFIFNVLLAAVNYHIQ